MPKPAPPTSRGTEYSAGSGAARNSKSRGNLDRLFRALDDATVVLRTDAQGAISIGTSNGRFGLIEEEAGRRHLAPRQLMVLAALRLRSTPEEILARGFGDDNPSATGRN